MKAIEVGNIFKLGTKFSDALGLTFSTSEGGSLPVVMGSYGIGPARVMGSIVESCHDENGIIWPVAVAPYGIHIISIGKDERTEQESGRIYRELSGRGFEVLWDDRQGVSDGFKFTDSDLIGCPLRIVISS